MADLEVAITVPSRSRRSRLHARETFMWYAEAMNDDEIIQQRISGCTVSSIAKSQGRSVSQINEAIDRWAESAITDKIRKHTLAFELARLDELQETFYARALVTKIV